MSHSKCHKLGKYNIKCKCHYHMLQWGKYTHNTTSKFNSPPFCFQTLWDHDAFGRDFLGSISLGEEEVRGMSVSDAPVWCLLEGTKSGYLEVRIKVISDDYEVSWAYELIILSLCSLALKCWRVVNKCFSSLLHVCGKLYFLVFL